MNFSENLRRLRKSKDIKQEALAEAMNVSRQTVSKWENGTAMPDFKKLNALAEYFGVTIDELLGFSNDKNNNDNINDYTKEYINELITLENMQSSEKIKELYKKLKTCAVIFCVALAVIIFFMISINNQIDNLKSQINNAQSPQIIQNDSDDSSGNTHDISDDASCEILSFDNDKPWIAKIRFAYSPQTYTNSLKVSLNITDKNGDTKQLDYDNKNGKFTLETELDISEYVTYVLIAKDDSTTSTVDLALDFTDKYFSSDFESLSSNIDVNDNKFIYDNDYLSPSFYNKTGSKLKSGTISFSFKNEKPFLEKKCKISTDEDNKASFICNAFEVDLGENHSNSINIKYTMIDENGIKYSTVYNAQIENDASFDAVKKEITFPNGKTITTNIIYD